MVLGSAERLLYKVQIKLLILSNQRLLVSAHRSKASMHHQNKDIRYCFDLSPYSISTAPPSFTAIHSDVLPYSQLWFVSSRTVGSTDDRRLYNLTVLR